MKGVHIKQTSGCVCVGGGGGGVTSNKYQYRDAVPLE